MKRIHFVIGVLTAVAIACALTYRLSAPREDLTFLAARELDSIGAANVFLSQYGIPDSILVQKVYDSELIPELWIESCADFDLEGRPEPFDRWKAVLHSRANLGYQIDIKSGGRPPNSQESLNRGKALALVLEFIKKTSRWSDPTLVRVKRSEANYFQVSFSEVPLLTDGSVLYRVDIRSGKVESMNH